MRRREDPRRPGRLVLALLLCGSLGMLVGCGEAPAPPGLAIPWPALEGMAPDVAAELRDARGRIEAAAGGPEAARLAALVEGGMLHHAYGLLPAASACYAAAEELAPEDPRWPYLRGVVLQRDNDLQGAAGALAEALDRDPAFGAAAFRLARLQFDQGRLEEAERLYHRALELAAGAGSRAAALVGLGRIAVQKGEFETARRRYEEALAAQPRANRIHALLADAYRSLGQLDAAREQLELQGPVEASFEDPLLAEVSARASGVGSMLQRGDAALLAGELEEALEIYRQALEVDQESAEAHQTLGAALYRAGDLDGALESFRRAAELEPERTAVHANLAFLLERAGDREGAIEHYEVGLERDPGDLELQVRRASLLADLGREEEAREGFAAAARLPGDRALRAHAHHSLGRLLLADGARREGIVELERAFELAPERAGLRRQLGGALASEGRCDEALEHFVALVDTAPRDVSARLLEVACLLRLERYAEAQKRLESGREAIESAELEAALARLLATAPDEAVRDGETALRLAQSSLEAEPSLERAELVAMALAESGRFEEAVAWQQRLLAEIPPDLDPRVRQRLEAHLERYRQGQAVRLP